MKLYVFREDTAKWIALWRKVLLHAPGTVISNRVCAAALAWRPAQTGSGYIYTLTYGVMDNPYGFKIEPVIQSMRIRSFFMLRWTDKPHRLWYTWRAPTWIYLADIILLLQMIRYRRLVLLLPGAVLLAQQLNVTVLNPSQDARYMFGSFMIACAFLSIAALLPRALVAPGVSDRAAEVEAEPTDEVDVEEDEPNDAVAVTASSNGAAAEDRVRTDQVVVDGVDADRGAG
jgi:hypothetical protein